MPEVVARVIRAAGAFALVALVGVGAVGGRYVSARAMQPAASAPSPATPSIDANLLDRYCLTCHNARLKTAGLEIDSLDVQHVGDNAQQWEKIVTKLRTREMPPPGRPRPDGVAYDAAAAALERDLDAVAAAKPHPGRVPVHRLNRNEYT